MYKSFYNLKRNPFDITPDPSFLFPTKRHNEALAALYYGVRRHKGFVVLTGEVGTGKTLLLHYLLQLLKKNNDVAYAYIFNGRLRPVEFLQYVASDLGLPGTSKNKGELLLQIAHYVIERSQQKLTTALVVDEAHHLSTEILEEIRLLTNLETPQQKLLQILLVGQPELDEKLDSVSLRQLKQRIALRSHLDPLSSDETKGYVVRRLQIAGCPYPSALFPPETIAAVYQHSQGLPRLINTICENALIAGYGRQMRTLSPDIIDDIAADFRLGVQTPSLERDMNSEDLDAGKAAQTLLDLYARLRAEQRRDEEVKTRLRFRVGEQ
jgi:general secretion pathway protein A